MIYKDIIYGNIELNGIYEEIANSKDFLRLKDIVQTAMSSLKYPDLEQETRYEHSIGVYYLMCRTLNNLEKKLSKDGLHIDKEEKEIAKLAALLHDIGHGVHSHLLERIMNGSHEQKGIDIVRDSSTQIHQIIVRNYGEEFIDKLVQFMDCIYGKTKVSQTAELREDNTVPLKSLLGSLISHNIDLDRLDYLIRESAYTKLGTLTNYEELINSFECVLAGNQIILAIPEEKQYMLEANILERTRNYNEIYFCDDDYKGEHALEQLLAELKRHPEEVPNTIPEYIRKFLTQDSADFTIEEYMMLTNKTFDEAISQIASTTKSEKIKYLCNYKQNAKNYRTLHNGRSEEYIRKLLKKVIPEFPEDSACIFSQTRTIKPYSRNKFGSTNIITSQGIKNFEDLPHGVSLDKIEKTVTAINPEILRLELGMEEKDFQERYAEVVQEIIENQSKPTQEFELKYVTTGAKISYDDIIGFLTQKYCEQDKANYMSRDVYYDDSSLSLLKSKRALRIRDGITYHNGVKSRDYKNRRITYKKYVEDDTTTYTDREKLEEIGDSTNLEDYAEFLDSVGLPKDLSPVLEVNNFRKLVTILVNNQPIDISFNVANYRCSEYDSLGNISTIEIRPRDNQIIGRMTLLEIKRRIEEEFPNLKELVSSSNIYELGMKDVYEKYINGKKEDKFKEDEAR